MKKLVLPVIILVPIFSHHQSAGQVEKVVKTQRFVWLAYINKIRLSARWSLSTELEDRRYAFPDRQSELILPRVTLTREVGSGWNAGVGVAHFQQSSPDNPETDIDYVRPEIRPHQELNYSHPLGARRLTLAHRYRLEERFIHKASQEGLEDGYSFNFRMGYRVQVAFPLTRKDSGRRPLVARAYDELMINLGKSIVQNSFDQNRLGVALNYELKKNIQFQVDFVNIFKQRAGYQYNNQYVQRFTLLHTIDFRKK